MSDLSENQPPHRLHIWQFQFLRDIAWILAGFGLLYLGAVLQAITVPILIGLGLAYLFEPVIGWATRRFPALTRTRVVVWLLILLLSLLVALAAVLVPLAVTQAGGLVRNVPRYTQGALHYLEQDDQPEVLREWVGEVRQALPAGLGGRPAVEAAPETVGEGDVAETPVAAERIAPDEATVQLLLDRLQRDPAEAAGGMDISALRRAVGAVIGFVLDVGAAIVDAVFTVFLIAFFFVVFSTGYPRVRDFARSLIPDSQQERTLELLAKMDAAVSGFVRGRLVIAAVLGLVFAIGWSLCGVPHAVLLGLVTGFFTLVPYLCGIGLPIAWILLAVHTLSRLSEGGFYISDADGSAGVIWWLLLLMPTIVFVVAQLLDDYVLSPIIQGRATNLSPASIIVAVLAGGSLAGLYGMLLAIPVAACIRILITDVLAPKIQAWLHGEAADPLPISE